MFVTILVVRQLHVEADVIWQRTQVLHQSVELPHQQDAGLLGVATCHGRHVVVVVVVVVAGTKIKQLRHKVVLSVAFPRFSDVIYVLVWTMTATRGRSGIFGFTFGHRSCHLSLCTVCGIKCLCPFPIIQ